MSRGEENMSLDRRPFQFRSRSIFLVILAASTLSLVWRWDRQTQESLIKEAADHETSRNAEIAAARQLAKELDFQHLPTNVTIESEVQQSPVQTRIYDQTLLNDLPEGR